jgi:penicillin amidase
MRTEGNFPAKWKGQGDFVMPGNDSSYMWQGMIPENETPYQYNPERGFVSSANQRPVDSTYPYYLGREYPTPRGVIVNRKLASMQAITPQDMMQMQTNNYNVFAEMATPLFVKNIQTAQLNSNQQRFFGLLKQWNFNNDYHAKGATVFALAWQCLKDTVYNDEYAQAPAGTARPLESTLLEALLKDSTYPFIDLVQTPQKESLADIVTIAFQMAVDSLVKLEKAGKLEWGKCKDTYVGHLLKIPAFSRLHLPIGGGTNVINATKENHGPSWRMVISLTPQTEAYGVYPGGQSGNPGSKYYDSYVDQWAAGQYYALWMMTPTEQNDPRVKWKMSFSK